MVLNIGLTGGIGSGKSAASSQFASLGAVIVDADKISREVVEPGSEGLAAIVEAFGEDILDDTAALDRPKLAGVVFGDEAARAKLNAIVHPAVRRRSAELIAEAGPGAIIINDIPLLAEGTMAPSFHLVLVVDTPAEVRLERLIGHRGMSEDDVRARIAAQASDEQRRAIADVLIDNSGTPEDLASAIGTVWTDRIIPFAENLHSSRAADQLTTTDPSAWLRVQARLRFAVEPLGGVVSSNSEGFDIEAAESRMDQVRSVLAKAGWFAAGTDTFRSADPACSYRVRAVWNATR